MTESKKEKLFSLMFHLEVKTNGSISIAAIDNITGLLRQAILQATTNGIEISYVSCEILGIDGEQ